MNIRVVPFCQKALSLLVTHQLHDLVTDLVLPPDLLLGSTDESTGCSILPKSTELACYPPAS